MKSDRRHELKTNALAHTVEVAPAFFRDHGNKLMLAAVVILLAVVLYRNHVTSVAENLYRAQSGLSAAQTTIGQLWSQPLADLDSQPRMAAHRDELVKYAEENLEEAERSAVDTKLRAEIYVARGDLNWHLANLPALPQAATQPTMELPKSAADYLNAARSAYGEVLKDPLSQNVHARTAAHLGLAAIDENDQKWDDASAEYGKVIDDNEADAAMKQYARGRRDQLADLRSAPLLANGTGELPATSRPSVTLPPSPLGPDLPLSLNPITGASNALPLPASSAPATGPTSVPASPAPTSVPATAPSGAATAPTGK